MFKKLNKFKLRKAATILGGIVALAGGLGLALSPFLGSLAFQTLWGIEPLAYLGALVLMAGLAVLSASYILTGIFSKNRAITGENGQNAYRWNQVTQQYFELFDHDLGRPLRRVLGKERELRAILESSGPQPDPRVLDLLDEIERQTPNFRLMLSNIQVLVQLEGPNGAVPRQPVEPSGVVRKIVDRYATIAAEANKEITWWAEPGEFGIVNSDSSTIEHIVTNLVDNAVRFAEAHIEVKLTKNPTHFFIRVWDDGPGIPPQYLQHIFDRGWTPEVARREEKPSSGLGLFIGRTLAGRCGGELAVDSQAAPNPNHFTAFLLGLPLGLPTAPASDQG